MPEPPQEASRELSKWAILVGIAGVALAGVVVAVAVRRRSGEPENVPALIDGCFEKIKQLEAELHRIRPTHEPAA